MCDLLILCAVDNEYRAIRSSLENPVASSIAERVYIRGQWHVGQRSVDVVLRRASKGDVSAHAETKIWLDELSPKVAIFIGVAGSVKSDLSTGDVVVASEAQGYDSRKERPDGSVQLRPAIQQLPTMGPELFRALDTEAIVGFQVELGPVAAGGAVMADPQGQALGTVIDNFGESLAVEQEGYGFATAVRQEKFENAILIRAISDQTLIAGDKSKSDAAGGQAIAAIHAIEVAKLLLNAGIETNRFPKDFGVDKVATATHGVLDQLRSAGVASDLTTLNVLVNSPGSELSKAILRSGVRPFAVIDVDPSQDASSLRSFASGHVRELGAAPHTLSPDVNSTPGIDRIQWLVARGFVDLGSAQTRRAWVAEHRPWLGRMLRDLAGRVGTRRVRLWLPTDRPSDTSVLEAVTEEVLAAFQERAEVLELNPRAEIVSEELVDAVVTCNPVSLGDALSVQFPVAATSETKFQLTGRSGTVEISEADALFLEERVLPVWLSSVGEPQELDILAFLRGGSPTWAVASEPTLPRRQAVAEIVARLVEAREQGGVRRINVFHAPGAGGSTAARMALAQYVNETVVLEVVSNDMPGVAERVALIHAETQKSPVILVDRAEIDLDAVSDLQRLVSAAQTDAVIVHVSRRARTPSSKGRSIFISAVLELAEAELLARFLGDRVPSRRYELEEALVRCRSGEATTAFELGLAVFDDGYERLESYIEYWLSHVDPGEADFLEFAAICYGYGQRGISTHLAIQLGVTGAPADSRPLDAISDGAAALLRYDVATGWRVMHQLVAHGILRARGGKGWQAGLADKVVSLMARLAEVAGDGDDEIDDLLEGVILHRPGEDPYQVEAGPTSRARFAPIIEAISSDNARATVFEAAHESFPANAHIAAHLARFYAFGLGNDVEAEKVVDVAVALAPRDGIVHHMRGMVLRHRAYAEIDARRPLAQVLDSADAAGQAFERSRNLQAGDSEYSYVSEAQLGIRVYEYAANGASLAKYAEGGDVNERAVAWLERASSLIGTIPDRPIGSLESDYVTSARARALRAYGDYADAEQTLEWLLARTDDKSSVRRQLGWLYVAKAGNRWQDVPPTEAARVVDLIGESLREQRVGVSDLYQWWAAIRREEPPQSLNSLLTTLDQWSEVAPCRELAYYTYILEALQLLDGTTSAGPRMLRNLEKSREGSRYMRTRTESAVWLGHGAGVQSLVDRGALGQWDHNARFFADTSLLKPVKMRVMSIAGPQAGEARKGLLPAFIVPGRAGLYQGRNEGDHVEGFLGFSAAGPRLWNVTRCEPEDAEVEGS